MSSAVMEQASKAAKSDNVVDKNHDNGALREDLKGGCVRLHPSARGCIVFRVKTKPIPRYVRCQLIARYCLPDPPRSWARQADAERIDSAKDMPGTWLKVYRAEASH
jgi:hypothetical protein